ncbi:hypothetical protein ESCO_000767 [Escovopsis weberi]|uniref:Uncharacterized protein n=1 Tax=Escovopsis weberi TaxID=150374 RepID=A0A0M8N3Y5_ESCWE|nr:hypothetical protein ESCO_000767 [Escovopsis weberi]
MARRASAAEERRRGRAGPKSIRGRISDPIPISSPFDEMLLAKSRQAASSFVPVTKIDLPPARALALANPRRSFVVGAAGDEGAGPLPSPSSLGSRPNRFSDYWSPPSRLERFSQAVSEPAAPPLRSELRLSVVHVAASSDAQPNKAAGTGTGTTTGTSSTSTGTSIRDALRHMFGWRRARRTEPIEPVEPVESLLQMQNQLKAAWRHDGSAPVMSFPRRPCLSREHDGGMATVTDYNRALRSHSVGLEDVLAIQSARNSIVRCQSYPSGDPGLDMADAARLQTRLSGIEDHLHRVEALLTRVCRIIPECQPRSENADCKLPASLSSYAQQTTPDSSTGCSSPSSTVYSFSHGEASPIADELPVQPLRASASVPTLRDEKVSSFTLGPLTALMGLIESERSSSLVLESRGRRTSGDELGAAIPRNDSGVAGGDNFPAGPNPREIYV